MTKRTIIPENQNNIRAEIVERLKTARSAAARHTNSIMTAVYWEIGRRIVKSEQSGAARANYGDELIKCLANDLSNQFGRGFSAHLAWVSLVSGMITRKSSVNGDGLVSESLKGTIFNVTFSGWIVVVKGTLVLMCRLDCSAAERACLQAGWGAEGFAICRRFASH